MNQTGPIKGRHYADAIGAIILTCIITLLGIVSWLVVPIGIIILILNFMGG